MLCPSVNDRFLKTKKGARSREGGIRRFLAISLSPTHYTIKNGLCQTNFVAFCFVHKNVTIYSLSKISAPAPADGRPKNHPPLSIIEGVVFFPHTLHYGLAQLSPFGIRHHDTHTL